eukprot:CAMPEP_0185749876 /NCGR_PEP_ID=MMETSP1174-20130828/8593_1 /TAXON_ID=35687 /ORGANISM="Dictyocha speculum, Strain CCMP1381" /LENGTH=327 /DNA_ID=CAMNT_0028426179 /DNA_START=170 /DNA_END=1152 /DNA_ORIENTATION=+
MSLLVNVDFSLKGLVECAVDDSSGQTKVSAAGAAPIELVCADALHLPFMDARFSVVLEKGLLDAMVDTDDVIGCERSAALFREVARVLKADGGGVFLLVTLAQDHILRLLSLAMKNQDELWAGVRVEPLSSPESESPLLPFLFRIFRAREADRVRPPRFRMTFCDTQTAYDDVNDLPDWSALEARIQDAQSAFVVAHAEARCAQGGGRDTDSPHLPTSASPTSILLVVEIKPLDAETDLEALLTSALGCTQGEGGSELRWLSSALVPMCFGLRKVRMEGVLSPTETGINQIGGCAVSVEAIVENLAGLQGAMSVDLIEQQFCFDKRR